MTTEETTKAILSRVEDSVKELRADVRTILTTMALKADVVQLHGLEERVRVLETTDAEDRGGRRYRGTFPMWAGAVVAALALGVSIWNATH